MLVHTQRSRSSQHCKNDININPLEYETMQLSNSNTKSRLNICKFKPPNKYFPAPNKSTFPNQSARDLPGPSAQLEPTPLAWNPASVADHQSPKKLLCPSDVVEAIKPALVSLNQSRTKALGWYWVRIY
jgi:hypothetical protein